MAISNREVIFPFALFLEKNAVKNIVKYQSGLLLSRGPALPADYTQPPFMLLYSIGGYITSE